MGETTLGQPVPIEIPPEVRQRRIDNDERGLGLSLIGRLLRGCLERDVTIKTECRGVELVMEDNRVAGVVLETPAGTEAVVALPTSSWRPVDSNGTNSYGARSSAGR